MKKLLSILLVLMLVFSLAACGEDTTEPEETDPEISDEPKENQGDEPEVITTASIVNEEDAFLNAISEEGTWIIATLTDFEFDEEIAIEGEFHDKGDDSKELYRKLALYEQDEDRNVTDRYTLTAPKLTITSPNTNIQSGTFVGDIYVNADGFKLTDAKVDGNVYFATEEYQQSFTLDDNSEVTGETTVQE